MRLLNTCPALASIAMMAACATGEPRFGAAMAEHDLTSEGLAARDGQTIIGASITQIAADPEAWSGKWVALEGVLTLREVESRLYTDAAAAAQGLRNAANDIGIQMSEVAEPFANSLHGAAVTVVGRVDVTCILAHRAALAMTDDTHIAWASGFCHTSGGPHLDLARVQAIRSKQ